MAVDGGDARIAQAVQVHLGVMQGVIARMATNSASAKGWCITLVAAVLVIVADKGRPELVWIALIPTLLFLVLDAHYLALERALRASYNAFIEKLHVGRLSPCDLYVVAPEGGVFTLTLKALGSFSIWPFYCTLLLMIWLTRILVPVGTETHGLK